MLPAATVGPLSPFETRSVQYRTALNLLDAISQDALMGFSGISRHESWTDTVMGNIGVTSRLHADELRRGNVKSMFPTTPMGWLGTQLPTIPAEHFATLGDLLPLHGSLLPSGRQVLELNLTADKLGLRLEKENHFVTHELRTTLQSVAKGISNVTKRVDAVEDADKAGKTDIFLRAGKPPLRPEDSHTPGRKGW